MCLHEKKGRQIQSVSRWPECTVPVDVISEWEREEEVCRELKTLEAPNERRSPLSGSKAVGFGRKSLSAPIVEPFGK